MTYLDKTIGGDCDLGVEKPNAEESFPPHSHCYIRFIRKAIPILTLTTLTFLEFYFNLFKE